MIFNLAIKFAVAYVCTRAHCALASLCSSFLDKSDRLPANYVITINRHWSSFHFITSHYARSNSFFDVHMLNAPNKFSTQNKIERNV